MPKFDTPQPISITLSLLVADVRLVTGERTDTVVELGPANPNSKADVKIAEQTRVEYADGRLLVKTPKQLGSLFGRTGSIELTIHAPQGSSLSGDSAMGALSCDGPLGECRFKSGLGKINLGRTGALQLVTGGGDISVDRAEGEVHVNTGTGTLRIRHADGHATIKNSAGTTWIGEVTGELRIGNAAGDITVERAHAGVTAKTAHGAIRIGEVRRGSVVMETAMGDLEVGIRPGTAAWLDVNTTVGHVRNQLDAVTSPEKSDETVEIRARTYQGDIIIHRS
jgi:DUF4097 and DUF4098 domain-containing protein YvlB